MAELKYPTAVYREKVSGELKTIQAKDLADPDILEIARREELFDISEQTRLAARAGDINAKHFSGLPTEGGRRLLQGERNPEHDARVEQLVDTLKTEESWTLGMLGAKKKDGSNPEFIPENTLFNYRWDSEVHRIMDENTIVRHDVFGASSELSMSVRQPSIAIEIIKTHYPEETAFAAFIEKSRREPLIIFFDVIEYNNKKYSNTFIKVDTTSRKITYRHYTFMVREGKVYQGNKATEIDSSARLRIDVENMISSWEKHWKKTPASKS